MRPESALIPIRVVSLETGLSAHVLRAWEKRYGVPRPARTSTNRRLYSAGEVGKLRLLARLIEAGFSIGQIAGMEEAELRELEAQLVRPAVSMTREGQASSLLGEALSATLQFDPGGVENVLTRASLAISRDRLVEEFLAPLIQRIGDGWETGTLRIAHEHMVSAALRTMMASLLKSAPVEPRAPLLVVSTPAGHRHELGALMVALQAATAGWRTAYLGPDLPVAELSLAARQLDASALALSIVFPPPNAPTVADLRMLRAALKDLPILLGGRAVPGLGSLPAELGMLTPELLRELPRVLAELAAGRR